MIRHCVFLRIAQTADREALETVLGQLGALVDKLDGCSNFLAGPNRDFEDKTPDFTHGFTLDAATRGDLEIYANHPEHRALGSELVALCGGPDGIVVYDLEA